MPLAAKNASLDKIGRYESEILWERRDGSGLPRARSRDRRIVADKTVEEELCVDKEYVNRFLREIQGSGRHLASQYRDIFDVGRLGDTPYITMEFLDEKLSPMY